MSRPGTYYQDGFCGGSELPQDTDLDQMIYPERPKDLGAEVPWHMGQTAEERNAQLDAAYEADRLSREERDRQFVITEGNPTGANPGPPRKP